MKTFPTLYKRTKTGAIQYWSIEVIEASLDKSGWNIIKNSGQLGTTSPIVHKETIVTGKQKRTVQEQAEFQAESDWKKKRDEGYKSLEDLGLRQEQNGVVFISQDHSPKASAYYELQDALNLQLPQFNTDASGNVKPMLAVDWAKVKSIKYPTMIQPKLDGMRALCVVRYNVGADNPIMFLTRQGKPYTTLGHIESDIGLYCFKKGKMPTEFILDGEIYSDELSFQEIVSAAKALKENSKKLMFRVYDIVSDDKQDDRFWALKSLVETKLQSDFIKLVETRHAQSAEEVKQFHDEWVQAGYEGAMIRLMDGKYEQGARSRSLLKVKEFDETEFIFECMEQGQREEDLIAVCRTSDGKKFKAKMVGNRAYKQSLLAECGDLQETPLTVKHFGYTADGLPRFPIGKAFRDGY